jgi:DUF4097 and DUF4098 domain-containing protein YvlB
MASDQVLRRSFETTGPARIRVGVPEGIVEVEAVDAPSVDVEVTVLKGDPRVLEDVRIEASDRAGGLEVAVQAQFERWGFRASLRRMALLVRVSCPPGSALVVTSASADVKCAGTLGAVEVKSASGDVIVQRVASLSAQSASGDVIAREVDADADVKTTSGDLQVRSVGGDLTASAVSGDVQVGSVGGGCRVSTVSGDIEVGELAGEATVNGVSGDVELGIPPGRRLWLDVRSASGDVRSDLDVDDTPPAGEGRAQSITVRTVSGDVRLRRAG